MGDTTISWTQKTWNWMRGCSRTIAEDAETSGCGDQTGGGCYAERMAWRFAGPGQPYAGLVRMTPKGPRWTGKVIIVDNHLLDPLRWRTPCTIFTNSVSDPFHESLTNEEIAIGYGVMAHCPRHTFQNLTKRAKRRREWHAWVVKEAELHGMTPVNYCVEVAHHHIANGSDPNQVDAALTLITKARNQLASTWPLPNVWEGVSVEHMPAAIERIPELLLTPAAVRFLSCEPLIGEIDLIYWLDPVGSCDCSPGSSCNCEKNAAWRHTGRGGEDPALDWVIAGAESGPRARTTSISWYELLRDRCKDYRVPFFLKQAYEDPGPRGTLQRVKYGTGSWFKGRTGDHATHKPALIELPYFDGQQHTAMPELAHASR